MFKEALRPAWAEINLTNAAFNIKNIKSKVGPGVRIMGIIKADGYGHGSVKMAEVLAENGVASFGVATLEEAITLRKAGVSSEIVVLGLTPDLFAETIVEYDLTPVTCSSENAAAFSREGEKAGKIISGYVALDSGMGRIGYLPGDSRAVKDVEKTSHLSHFRIKGLFSHFATADEADKTYATQQESEFLTFYDKLLNHGITIPERTLCNSAGILGIPTAYFDTVRPGIILYGCYPSDEVDRNLLEIKPVMSVKASIVQLKKVGPDFSVGYGRRFISKRDSLIATIPLGYADGLPRPYSAFAEVLIRGVRAPLAGSICMDQSMIDVTDVPGVQPGDEVILMGSDGTHTILADDIGQATGTINYEIVCAFGQRLPKVYTR
jgi:alanine racemase